MLKTSYWYTFHPFYRSFSPGCDLNARECFDGPAASQQGMLGALIVWWPASFWLQWTMAEGTVHTGSPAKFQTKPTEEWIKIRKMYAIKQIKICAEYRDMLPRPRLDLSGTPGLRPIGLSPGSWQTSLGLGSMSRYSAQILICITKSHGTNVEITSGLLDTTGYHGGPQKPDTWSHNSTHRIDICLRSARHCWTDFQTTQQYTFDIQLWYPWQP